MSMIHSLQVSFRVKLSAQFDILHIFSALWELPGEEENLNIGREIPWAELKRTGKIQGIMCTAHSVF